MMFDAITENVMILCAFVGGGCLIIGVNVIKSDAYNVKRIVIFSCHVCNGLPLLLGERPGLLSRAPLQKLSSLNFHCRTWS